MAAAVSTVEEEVMVAAVTGDSSFNNFIRATTDEENELMRTQNLKFGTFRLKLAGTVAMAVLGLMLVGYARPVFAEGSEPGSGRKTFSSPTEACKALVQAVQNGDEEQLEAILEAGKEITSSNDAVEDKLERERFSQKFQEMHRFVREEDGKMILYIGAENWPFPIPLVSKNGVWYFDSDTGKQEITFRTIGENEATAIEVCDAFVTERKQGNTSKGDDPIAGYAQTLVSTSAGNTSTTAAATADKETHPFEGYYFRPKKNGGRIALVAYPTEYRTSGVMTFLVTQAGVVYEKDLGPNTKALAPDIKGRSLDASWHKAE